MATAAFPALDVIHAARAKLRAIEVERHDSHEANIAGLMSIQLTKWEWRSLLPHRVRFYRDREAAERAYGSRGTYHHTSRWWTDTGINDLKARAERILKMARAAYYYNAGFERKVTLDVDDVAFLGIQEPEQPNGR